MLSLGIDSVRSFHTVISINMETILKIVATAQCLHHQGILDHQRRKTFSF
jgi:hypothetical protein